MPLSAWTLLRKKLLRIYLPNGLSEPSAIALAICLFTAILIADLSAPNEISLRILYVFPLALLVMHVASLSLLIVGHACILSGLAFSIYLLPISGQARVTQFLLNALAYILVSNLIRVVRQQYIELEQTAIHDSLTGLHNRQYFVQAVEAEMARQDRFGSIFSLAMIDLDGFKGLNDSKGHEYGDEALRYISSLMSSHTRKTDTLARLGGDEFALLMPNTDKQDCAAFCLFLVEMITARMPAAGYNVSASIGAITFAKMPVTAALAMKMADDAMYLAKQSGKAKAITMSLD